MGKKSRSGSKMNITDYIFWVKINKFFDEDANPE
jgi:hypothetical protein